MPWDIFRTGPEDTPYCVHKHDDDGEPIGKPLGCHATKEEAEKQVAALYANEKSMKAMVIHSGWSSELKVLRGDKKSPVHLEVLGVPFGGPHNGKDWDGEFFSPRTDIMLKIGDKRPVLYNHGADALNDPERAPSVIGDATYTRVDDKGHWFDVVIDDALGHAYRIVHSARRGMARASSGAVNYLVRKLPQTGEILRWAFSELSLIDKLPGKREASNDYAVAYLKSAFEQSGMELPEALAQGGEPEASATEGNCICEKVRVDPFYLVEARKSRTE